MIHALNMDLEIVRTVLTNQVNEVSVYADMKKDNSSHYTVISILSTAIAKELAERIAAHGLFSRNRDFIGSFTNREALCLVFLYHAESRLSNKEAIHATGFDKRKKLALSFLTALAETELTGDIGRLLITDKNINITSDGKVYLNYFFDFSGFSPADKAEPATFFYRDAARYAFEILTREFEMKYDRQIEMYPNEMRLMYKKIENRAFTSYSQIMAFVMALADKPREQRFGFMRFLDVFDGVRVSVMKKPAAFFLIVVVMVTAVYLGYQLTIRTISDKNRDENTFYVGMQTIGEVFLGEENV